MVYLKSLLAGLVAVVLSLVFLVAIVIAVNINLSQGSGGVGFVSIGLVQVAFVAGLIFAVGFAWEYRRASRPKS